MISSKKGKLYLKFFLAAALLIAAVSAMGAGGNVAYKVELSQKCAKELDKLERKDKHSYEVVIRHLKMLEQEPKCGKPLTGNLSGLWSCRADFWRIIYQVNEEAKTVFVITIGNRKDVYEKGDDYE